MQQKLSCPRLIQIWKRHKGRCVPPLPIRQEGLKRINGLEGFQGLPTTWFDILSEGFQGRPKTETCTYNLSMSLKDMKFSNIQHLSLYRLLQQLHLSVSCVTIHCWPAPSTKFNQYTLAYLFSDLLSNYPPSVRCPTKLEIANPPYQLHFIGSHPPHSNDLLPD